MKKIVWIVGLTLVLTAGVFGTAFAQDNNPPGGPGMAGWGHQGEGEGPLHDLMIEAAADLLGMEPADLEARLANGEKLIEIAIDSGMSAEEFRLEWREARQTVFESAVAEGLIERTQVRQWLGRRTQMRHEECPALGGFGNSPQSQ
jgi:hypothetical protein